MSAITKANVSIDDLVGGGLIACPTLTAIMAGASSSEQAALAAELQALIDANPADGNFSTLEVSDLASLNGGANVSGGVLNANAGFQADEVEIDTGTKTATAVTGAATLSKSSGVITTEALTTAAGAEYTLDITNTKCAAGDLAFAAVENGTNSQGIPVISTVDTHTAGHIVIKVENNDLAAAFNGTLKIKFFVVKAGAPT